MNMNTRPSIYSQLSINEYEHSTHQFTINYQSMNMNTQPLIYSQLPISEYEHSTINL